MHVITFSGSKKVCIIFLKFIKTKRIDNFCPLRSDKYAIFIFRKFHTTRMRKISKNKRPQIIQYFTHEYAYILYLQRACKISQIS